MSKRSYQYTRNANSKDVLWGNGAGKNQFFQDLLEEHCQIYASEEDSSARESLIDSIVDKIHIRGGRFLNKQASVEPFESSSLSLPSPSTSTSSTLSLPSPSLSLSLSLSLSTRTPLLLQNGRDSKIEKVDSPPLVSSSIELHASQRRKKVRDGLSRFAKKKKKKKDKDKMKKKTNIKVSKDHSIPPLGLPGVVCLKDSSIDVQDIAIRGTCYTSTKRQITMPTTNTKKRLKTGVDDIANANDREVETGVAIPVIGTTAATAIGGHTGDILMDNTTNDQATLFFGPLLSSVSSCGYSSSTSMDTDIGDIGTIFSMSFEDKRVPPTTDVIMGMGNDDNNDNNDDKDEDDISCLTFSNLIDSLDDTFPIPNERDTALNTGFLTSSSPIGWPMRIDRLANGNGKENMNMNVLGPFPSPSTRQVPDKSAPSCSSAALDPSSIDPSNVPSTRGNGQFQMDKYRPYNNDEKREATDSKICSSGENFMFANMPTVKSMNLPCVSLFLTTEKEQVVTEDTVMKTVEDPDQDEAMNTEILSS